MIMATSVSFLISPVVDLKEILSYTYARYLYEHGCIFKSFSNLLYPKLNQSGGKNRRKGRVKGYHSIFVAMVVLSTMDIGEAQWFGDHQAIKVFDDGNVEKATMDQVR